MWKLVAQAGLFVGGTIAGIVLAVTGGIIKQEKSVTCDTSGGDCIVAQAPAEGVSCPDGWANTSTQDGDAVSLSCSRGDWIVWLTPDGEYSHAWDGSGDFIFDPEVVPDWSSE